VGVGIFFWGGAVGNTIFRGNMGEFRFFDADRFAEGGLARRTDAGR
jgi:hypothetical protein